MTGCTRVIGRGVFTVAALLAGVATGCGPSGDGGEASPRTVTTAPTATSVPGPADPTVEPGTGTGVALDPPASAPVGAPVTVPLVVTVGRDVVTVGPASIEVDVEGPAAVDDRIDLAGLAPGGSATGVLVVDPAPGTAAAPSFASLTARLVLPSSPTVPSHATLGVLADGETVWMGFAGRGELERTRLRALLAAGEITQEEFDRAYAATLETPTGSVTVDD